jgi:[histone H3]-lysine36 N-dimethyltransferase SETMAR
VDCLISAFGDQAPSKTIIYRWFSEFKFGRSSLSDEFRGGRPSTSVVAKNIDAVRQMIEMDRHVTYREIASTLGIDMKQISTILHDHLAVKKLCARWIPQNLTEAQKATRLKWSKEMPKKFYRGASNLVITSSQMTKLGFIRMSPKLSNNRVFGYSKMN